MAKTNTNDTQKGVGLHARRIIAYVVIDYYLIFLSVLVLHYVYQRNRDQTESYNPDLPRFQVRTC